jgi:hypothetical protein
MLGSTMVSGNIMPEWIAQEEDERFISKLLPYFVGNLDDEPISIEQMKQYVNCHHPIINDNPKTGIPTVMFKLAVNFNGATHLALLTDWQVCGSPNQKPEDVQYWSVFSKEPEVIKVFRWMIDYYKKNPKHTIERLGWDEHCSDEHVTHDAE